MMNTSFRIALITKKRADYIKEYVPETEEPQRHELYRITKNHYDKAVYLLQKETGIYVTLRMAEVLAENYTIMRAYNYIDATIYNIPWFFNLQLQWFPVVPHDNKEKHHII